MASPILFEQNDDREFIIGSTLKFFNTLSLTPTRKYHGLRNDYDLILTTLDDAVITEKKEYCLSTWFHDDYTSKKLPFFEGKLGKNWIEHNFSIDDKKVVRKIEISNNGFEVVYKIPEDMVLKIKPFFVYRNINHIQKDGLHIPPYLKISQTKYNKTIKTVRVIRYPRENFRGYDDTELMTSFNEFYFEKKAIFEMNFENKSEDKWYSKYILRDSLLAGLPWFDDYVRDVMVVFDLLDAKMQKKYIEKIRKQIVGGRVPNIHKTSYNTVDAGLLYVNNLLDVEKEEGLHTAKKVLDSYVCGNEDYKMDGDFLIKTLKPRLTWMDTLDRRGKPIEINAYWQSAIKKYNELSDDKFPFEKNIEHSIEKFFENGKICDILEPENKEDLENNEKRPNFVIALEYLNPPTNVKKRILGHMEKFYTPRGLYSLLPNSFGYQEEYIGNQEKRDFSYHRGIIWPWLMIPYIKVLKKFDENKTDRLDEILGELEIMKNERCVGHISELVEPKTMQQCGCPAQLWSDAILEYLKKLKN